MRKILSRIVSFGSLGGLFYWTPRLFFGIALISTAVWLGTTLLRRPRNQEAPSET